MWATRMPIQVRTPATPSLAVDRGEGGAGRGGAGRTEDRHHVGQVSEDGFGAGSRAHVCEQAEEDGGGERDDGDAGFVCEGEDAGGFAVARDAVERSDGGVEICGEGAC